MIGFRSGCYKSIQILLKKKNNSTQIFAASFAVVLLPQAEYPSMATMIFRILQQSFSGHGIGFPRLSFLCAWFVDAQEANKIKKMRRKYLNLNFFKIIRRVGSISKLIFLVVQKPFLINFSLSLNLMTSRVLEES